jgi:ABC-2 type transport system permease protein
VWIGRLDPGQSLLYFGIGLGWAALLTMAVAWLWGKASTRVVVQGG